MPQPRQRQRERASRVPRARRHEHGPRLRPEPAAEADRRGDGARDDAQQRPQSLRQRCGQCSGFDDDNSQVCVGESIYYNNTVPEQIEACVQNGEPNPWPGPGKPRYVAKNVVGFAVDGENNWGFAFSKDGTVAAGSTTRIHNYRVPYRYHLPQGYKPNDIVGAGIDGENNWTFVWFRNGTVSAGTTEVLDKHRKPYRYALPRGSTPDDIVGTAIDGENNWCFAWYADGTVSAGTSENLAAHPKPEKVITGR